MQSIVIGTRYHISDTGYVTAEDIPLCSMDQAGTTPSVPSWCSATIGSSNATLLLVHEEQEAQDSQVVQTPLLQVESQPNLQVPAGQSSA